MRYNDRCIIVVRKEVEGYLGNTEVEEKKEVVCAISSFFFQNQEVGFGAFKKSGYRIHLKGYYQVNRVIYNNKTYQPITQHFHHNTTVLEVA